MYVYQNEECSKYDVCLPLYVRMPLKSPMPVLLRVEIMSVIFLALCCRGV